MRHPRDAAARRRPDLLTQSSSPGEGPAISIASHIVRAGKVDAFRDWADRYDRAAAGQPGFSGTVRLEQTGGVFHLAQRFDRRDQLEAWQGSAACRALAAEADPLSQAREQTGDGRTITFKLPGEADAAKWKRFLMTWAAVFPILLILNSAVGLTKLPQLARLAITSPLLTALLTWVVLPKVARWAKPWVLSDAHGRPRKPAD